MTAVIGGYSFTDTSGDGATVTFPFAFVGPAPGYLSKDTIFVYVRDSDVVSPTYGAYILRAGPHLFPTPNTITIAGAAIETPLDGLTNIRIRRIVDKTAPYAKTNTDDIFRKTVLNNSFLQMLYSNHEALDGFVGGSEGAVGNVNMNGFIHFNLGRGTATGHSVNFDQLQELTDLVNSIIIGDVSFDRVMEALGAPGGVDLVNGAVSDTELAAALAPLQSNQYLQGSGWKKAAWFHDFLMQGGILTGAFMGDSTMFGALASDLSQATNHPPKAWASALSLLTGRTHPYLNFGISGSTLRQMMTGTDGSGTTFEDKVKPGGGAQNAQVVYCNHGINDSQLDLSLEVYRTDLLNFVSTCRKYGKVPVLVTPNPNPPIGLINEHKGERLGAFVRVMRDVAKDTGTDLVDQFKTLMDSTNVLDLATLVPDGAHLDDKGYQQAGFNLSSVLYNHGRLEEVGDVTGLSNVLYNDNFTQARQMQNHFNRAGPILTAERAGADLQGVTVPVWFGKGTKLVSVLGLQYSYSTNCKLWLDGVPVNDVDFRRTLGNTNNIDWDAEIKVDLPATRAGLHLLTMMLDVPKEPADTGTVISLAGFRLPPVASHGFTGPSGTSHAPYYCTELISAGDILSGVFDTQLGFHIRGKVGDAILLVYRESSGAIFAETFVNEVSSVKTQLIASLPEGKYPITVSFNRRNLAVNIMDLGTVFTIPTAVSNCKLTTRHQEFSIARAAL